MLHTIGVFVLRVDNSSGRLEGSTLLKLMSVPGGLALPSNPYTHSGWTAHVYVRSDDLQQHLVQCYVASQTHRLPSIYPKARQLLPDEDFYLSIHLRGPTRFNKVCLFCPKQLGIYPICSSAALYLLSGHSPNCT